MTFGMMPIGALCSGFSYLGNTGGNRTTSYDSGGGIFNGCDSLKMDWSFLNTPQLNTGTIRGSFSWFGGGNCLGIDFGLSSMNFGIPSLNLGGFSWGGTSSIGAGFGVNNPFGNNTAAMQKFFGIDFTTIPKFGVSGASSFGSITSGVSSNSGTGGNSSNTFVPTSDYAENAARVAEQECAKGVRETSKNDSVDIRRYKNGARNSHQWCAYFTSYCFGAGQNKKPIFGFTGSSQHIRRQAEKAGVFAKKNSGYIPKRGDIAIWTNIGDPNHGHVGVVTKVYADGSFDVIEGNSSNRVKKNHYKSPTSVSKRFAGFCKTSEWAK